MSNSAFMTKDGFINRLRWFSANSGVGLPDEYGHPNYAPSRGETTLAGLLARWLDEQDWPADAIDPYEWLRNLPALLIEAFADLATDQKWAEARAAYARETGHAIPNLVEVHTGGIHRTLVAYGITRLMPLLAEAPWLRSAIETTLGAQQAVIDHAWRRFVRAIYRKLMPRIKAERHRGNVGTFGSTKLMTWACAGRVMFTFERPTGQVTYVADDSDMCGFRSGPNPPSAPFAECVAMIEDVITHWSADKLHRSDAVGLS